MSDPIPGAPDAPDGSDSGGPSRRVLVVAGVGLALIAAIVLLTLLAGPVALDRARQATAAPGADGVQELAVVVAEGVYAPNVLRAKAGAPLRLRIEVRERHSCATKLLVPDLGIDFDLPPMGQVDLLIPAQPAGGYLFTCGLKMVKGSLVFE